MTGLERNVTANQLSADRLSRYRKELEFHRANKTESSHLPLTNSFWKNICNIAGDSWLVPPRYKDLYGTDSVESLVKRPEFSESPLESLRVHTVSITSASLISLESNVLEPPSVASVPAERRHSSMVLTS